MGSFIKSCGSSHTNFDYCFKLPVKFCHDIKAMIRRFWRGQMGGVGDDRRKFIDRIGKVYANKRLKVACMGFRELVKFNETMLAKQV